LFVIDESDVHQFENPNAFRLAINKNRCICLTGSPDDQDGDGLERRVLNTFDIKRFDSLVGCEKEAETALTPQESKTVSLKGNQGIVEFAL
jgi:hypothetical protein